MTDISLLSTSEGDQQNETYFNVDSDFNNLASGIKILTQAFLSNLLTDQGSDITNFTRGGDLYSVVRKLRSFNDSLVTEISDAIRNVESDMINEQNSLGLPPKDRLKKVDILNIQKKKNREIFIELRLVSESGVSQVINI